MLAVAVVACLMTADEPWHLAGWPYRAEVVIPQPNKDGAEACGVTIHTHGRGRRDGADFRVVDAAGKAVPFLLGYHDPERYSLLLFSVAEPRGRWFVYFGNASATKPPEMSVVDPKPGAGPPSGMWIPRCGLILETRERPRAAGLRQETNPLTREAFADLLARSPFPHGAGFRRTISDGYNPFGPSDYYISAYRGWLRIPKDGTYQFCTVSNEGSFSFLDGKPLVDWPGQHTVERGLRGEKNVAVELKAGLHFIEYYQEEVVQDQMAFLGWRPSADKGPFAPIPEDLFVQPHAGSVRTYATPTGPSWGFQPRIVATLWLDDTVVRQCSRVVFEAPGAPADARWDFGDGQQATGAKVEHIYLEVGNYPVTLTIGNHGIRYPLNVFEVQHVTDQFAKGTPTEFLRLTSGYDRTALPTTHLANLIALAGEGGDWAEAVRGAEAFIERCRTTEPRAAAVMQGRMGGFLERLGPSQTDAALTAYRAALTEALPAHDRLRVLGRLARLWGVEKGKREQVQAVAKELTNFIERYKLDAEGLALYRATLGDFGDAYLWLRATDEASEYYRRKEALRDPPIAPTIRAARLGTYPNSLREYLAANNLAAATELLDSWEELFPTDKRTGQVFFWRGKVQSLRGESAGAEALLALAADLGIGSAFESEALWLRIIALEKLGRTADALAVTKKLARLGTMDEFVLRAKQRLQGKP